jgi:TPR repeat protein
MNEVPRQKLCEIIATYGRSVCEDQLRCRGLLNDVCGEHQKEIFVLLSALEDGVVTELLDSKDGVPRELLLVRLRKRLQENRALAEDACRWAVESWGLALGLVPEPLPNSPKASANNQPTNALLARIHLPEPPSVSVTGTTPLPPVNLPKHLNRVGACTSPSPGPIHWPQNPITTFNWFRHARTIVILSLLGLVIVGVLWSRKAADQDDTRQQFNLGLMYEHGRGVAKDEAQAVVSYRKAADRGHAGAQNNLGVMYAQGRGVQQNDQQAVLWYRRAAKQGNAMAQANLGWMYVNGRGMPKDDAQAVAWFRKAAEQGNAMAEVHLGWMYMNGRGMPKDDAQAVAWFRKAAEQGDAEGQFNLGAVHAEGRGVRQNDQEAVAWYRKAAEQGDAVAQVNLGWMYSNGRGVPKDDAQAVAWFRKAADQGNDRAQVHLGWMYENGRGVPKDSAQALAWNRNTAEFWYRKAADQGNEEAKRALQRLEK